MDKLLVRTLKNHYLARWAVLRHNQKNHAKILLVEDQFVLKNIVPGSTFCYNCLGEMYETIIPNLTTKCYGTCDNLILINNVEFKYKTVDEINNWLTLLAKQYLTPGGRILLSLEHRFLIYNRVENSVETLLRNWFMDCETLKVLRIINLLGKTQPGYGDYFFALAYSNE